MKKTDKFYTNCGIVATLALLLLITTGILGPLLIHTGNLIMGYIVCSLALISFLVMIIALILSMGEHKPKDKQSPPRPHAIFTDDSLAAIIVLKEYSWEVYYFASLTDAVRYGTDLAKIHKLEHVYLEYILEIYNLEHTMIVKKLIEQRIS